MKPKSYKTFNGQKYRYAGFTWNKKGVERRRKLWKKLNYKLRSIKRTKETLPSPIGYKAKYILYVRKNR